jgi:hypothetical protein
MIYKTLDTSIENANGTILNLALTKGAKILRVHDVKEAMECVTLFNKINLKMKYYTLIVLFFFAVEIKKMFYCQSRCNNCQNVDDLPIYFF